MKLPPAQTSNTCLIQPGQLSGCYSTGHTCPTSRQTAEVELFWQRRSFHGRDHTDGFLACQSDRSRQMHTMVR